MPQEPTQVCCRDCGHVMLEGEWTREVAEASVRRPECPNCGSTAREYRMSATVNARASLSYKAEVHDAGMSRAERRSLRSRSAVSSSAGTAGVTWTAG